jgi:hypothetical protein
VCTAEWFHQQARRQRGQGMNLGSGTQSEFQNNVTIFPDSIRNDER